MARITIEDCTKQEGNRFNLVLMASIRAKQLMRGAKALVRTLEILEREIETSMGLIGVTSVDLFTPVLTHVFGEGQLDGRVAVVSSHRLRPEAYGLPVNETLVFTRLEIEAVHELGHTFGLLHCFEPDCVMHASTYVEEIDLKSSEFCTECLRTLAGRARTGQSA